MQSPADNVAVTEVENGDQVVLDQSEELKTMATELCSNRQTIDQWKSKRRATWYLSVKKIVNEYQKTRPKTRSQRGDHIHALDSTFTLSWIQQTYGEIQHAYDESNATTLSCRLSEHHEDMMLNRDFIKRPEKEKFQMSELPFLSNQNYFQSYLAGSNVDDPAIVEGLIKTHKTKFAPQSLFFVPQPLFSRYPCLTCSEEPGNMTGSCGDYDCKGCGMIYYYLQTGMSERKKKIKELAKELMVKFLSIFILH